VGGYSRRKVCCLSYQPSLSKAHRDINRGNVDHREFKRCSSYFRKPLKISRVSPSFQTSESYQSNKPFQKLQSGV
jgi:hypothetical protein